jgi:subtilase family serine protease
MSSALFNSPYFRRALALAAISFCALPPASAQTRRQPRSLITGRVDESRLHRLAGNTRSQANSANDRGRVPGDLAMEHMLLQLQRPAEQEQALNEFIDQAHDPNSPNYQKWMTAEQFGASFGPAASDIAAVTGWLESKGLTVNSVSPSGMQIDFSGSAENVQAAFHTEIHYLRVNGATHLGNMTDPQIPEALAPAVAGVVSLHDFSPRAMRRVKPNYTYGSGSQTYQALTPADLATIYNFTPAYQAGYTGKGQTIAVIEDSDLYSTADWSAFRTTFGLDKYSGTLTTVHPTASGGAACVDPGHSNGDDGEASLDAEWAGAAAPDATIMLAACASTRTTFGGLIALQNLVNGANPPSIISISYGECEAENGAAANAAYSKIYQQAVAEGISVFVSAGDEGAASCDAGNSAATHGIGVSAFASTPYNVATGGTDFGDTLRSATSLYWGTTNSATYGSALSYIPEVPWNDSCASALLSGYLGYSAGYGASGFCASTKAQNDGLVQVVAGSGGPSGCATGSASATGVVGGTCKGYAAPSWQTGVAGLPGNGVRNLPDVSLFAGSGVWGHYYVFCWSDRRAGGAACTGAPSTWAGAGGTSFTAPILAGVQALINQKMGKAQGNPNYGYYKLAAAEYGTTGSASCTSSNGKSVGGDCTFYNVTEGDIAVDCAGSTACYGATTTTVTTGGGRRGGGGGTQTMNVEDGALSLSTSSYSPAYGTAAGWNFATGIGTVNVYNLVKNWPQ